MPSPTRLLQSPSSSSSSGQFPVSEPPAPLPLDSDVVVILAALLCALFCVVGLALVARCAWLRRATSPLSPRPPPPPTKGLKKKALRSLPSLPFSSGPAPGDGARKLAECAICLAEFAEGEEIRILPHCGHGFHVPCIDTWLAAHASCPSCRRVLVVPVSAASASKCQRCGALSLVGITVDSSSSCAASASSPSPSPSAPAVAAAAGEGGLGANATKAGEEDGNAAANRFLP